MSRPYPISHERGYTVLPRALDELEPLCKKPLALAIYMLLGCRVRSQPGWAQGSHGAEYLESGQCLAGENELAKRTGSSASTVRRSLALLEKLGLIVRKAEKQGSVITLCKYGEFSGSSAKGGEVKERQRRSEGEAAEKQRTGSGEATESKERITVNSKRITDKSESKPKFDFEAVYKNYPRKSGKKAGLKACEKLITTPEQFAKFTTAVDAMAKGWRGHSNEFCEYFSTFVNAERWEDGELPMPKNKSTSGSGHYKVTGSEVYAGGEVKI